MCKQTAEKYQPLFDHMMDEYGLTLLTDELDEIMVKGKPLLGCCSNCPQKNKSKSSNHVRTTTYQSSTSTEH